MRDDCEHAALPLLALPAPVAGELHQVVTVIQLVGDLTSMGALSGPTSRREDAPRLRGCSGFATRRERGANTRMSDAGTG
jgi:hypothetical protein